MRIFIPSGTPKDDSAYLAESLRAFGLCFAERCSLRDALAAADPRCDLILLSSLGNTSGIESFLQTGGSVVAIRPREKLERLAGLQRDGEHDGPSRLRWVQPICHGAQGEPLWTIGPVTRYESNSNPDVLAYLFRPGEAGSESPGVFERPVGQGRLIVYAYDFVRCIARLRQGCPERVGLLPLGDKRPRSLYLHEPNPPPDTLWRPTADLHCVAMCEVINRLLQRHAPVPTLWHLPGGSPAILLCSGDEDVSTQDDNDQQMSALESVDGSMSLYVLPDDTSITREQIEEYTRRGHSISVHPDLVPAAGQSVDAQLARAEQQVRLFQEKFDWPVRTVRNHSYGWPGYLELPELWERLGIGLDATTAAYFYRLSPDGGPFANAHAAMPLPFVREDGSLIDVYQQITHINDDVWSHPEAAYSMKLSAEQFDWIARRIFDDAVQFFHAPICANIHPFCYVAFSGPHARVLFAQAQELKLPIWSLDRWHNFWRARAAWRMNNVKWDGAQLSVTLAGPACEPLWVIFPQSADGRMPQVLTLNGKPTPLERVTRYGRIVAQAPIGAGASEVKAVVDYGSTG